MMNESAHAGYELEPLTGYADSLMVMLHGYGADGSDMIGVAQVMSSFLPSTHFVAPNAPEPCWSAPGCFQWYGFEHGPSAADIAAEHLAPRINQYCDLQLERLQMDSSQLIIMGFSQGAGIAIQTALSRASGCAALISATGRVPNRKELSSYLVSRPPALLVHGSDDDVIPLEKVMADEQLLMGAGLEVHHHISPGIGHTLDESGATSAAMFAASLLYGIS